MKGASAIFLILGAFVALSAAVPLKKDEHNNEASSATLAKINEEKTDLESKAESEAKPSKSEKTKRAGVSQTSNSLSGHGGTSLSVGDATVAGQLGRLNNAFQTSNSLSGDFGTSISKGLAQAVNGNANQKSTALSGHNGVSLSDGTANAINGKANQNSLSISGEGGTSLSTGKANSIGMNAGANQQSTSMSGNGGTSISSGSATAVSDGDHDDHGPYGKKGFGKRSVPSGCKLDTPVVHKAVSSAIQGALLDALKKTRSIVKRALTKVHHAIALSGNLGDSLAQGTSDIVGEAGTALQDSFAKAGAGGTAVSDSGSSVETTIWAKKRSTPDLCPTDFEKKVGETIEIAVMNALKKFE